MTLLELEDVSKSFLDGARELVVLDGVSVEFGAMELVGVYGERRSGKSTLLKVAAGLELPDEGTVSFQGKNIANQSFSERARLRRQHGIAFVSGDWRPELAGQPAIEHVALPLTSDGLTLAEAETTARAVLDRFEVMRWHMSRRTVSRPANAFASSWRERWRTGRGSCSSTSLRCSQGRANQRSLHAAALVWPGDDGCNRLGRQRGDQRCGSLHDDRQREAALDGLPQTSP